MIVSKDQEEEHAKASQQIESLASIAEDNAESKSFMLNRPKNLSWSKFKTK